MFVAGVSSEGFGSLFHCRMSQSCTYDSDDVATYLTQKASITLRLTDRFAKGAKGRFSAFDRLFFPFCDLQVLPVVLTSRNTKHVTAHTPPYGGGGLCLNGRRVAVGR